MLNEAMQLIEPAGQRHGPGSRAALRGAAR